MLFSLSVGALTAELSRVRFLWPVLLLAVGIGSIANGQNLVEIQSHQLSNGLRVLLVEDHSLPTFSLQLWVKAGSKDSRSGATTTAALVEQLLVLPKTSAAGGSAATLTNRGGDSGSYANQDVTVFFCEAEISLLQQAFQTQSAKLRSLSISDKKLQLAKSMLRARMLPQQSASARAVEELYAASFLTHSYRWPAHGWATDLSNVGKKECQDFFKTYYTASNATLIVVGDTTMPKVRSLANRYFAGLRRRDMPPRLVTPEAEQRGARQVTLHHPSTSPLLVAGYRAPERAHADYYPLKAVLHILALGDHSRMQQSLVKQKQLALAVSAELTARHQPGLLVFAAGLTGGKTGRSEQQFIDEINQLKSSTVEKRELARAKNRLQSELLFSLAQPALLAQRLGEVAVLAGDPSLLNSEVQKIKAITAEDIARVAQTYLHEDRRTLVRLVPSKGGQIGATEWPADRQNFVPVYEMWED